jgi:hypothetical protein
MNQHQPLTFGIQRIRAWTIYVNVLIPWPLLAESGKILQTLIHSSEWISICGLIYDDAAANIQPKTSSRDFLHLNFSTKRSKNDCATKRRITKRQITKRRNYKTSNYKTPITKRRKLQKVELHNVELQNAESYKRWKNKRLKVTKHYKTSNYKTSNVTKGRKTVQQDMKNSCG